MLVFSSAAWSFLELPTFACDERFPAMRSEGFSFYFGGLGVELAAAFMIATVRNCLR
jgi:hypothetical protein